MSSGLYHVQQRLDADFGVGYIPEGARTSQWNICYWCTTDIDNVAVSQTQLMFTPRTCVLEAILAQDDYKDGLISGAALSPVLDYGGFSLRAALSNETRDLPADGDPAFPLDMKLCQKMSVRLQVLGHSQYTHQVTITRANHKGPTRGQLANVIAREVEGFIRREQAAGLPLQYHGRELGLDDLVLFEVHHVSRGSLQPIIGILSP